MDVIEVVRLPMDLSSFGLSAPDDEVASEPYTLTTPWRDLTEG